MKSSTKERLVKAWKNPLLAGMATIAKSPTQLDEVIKELNESLKELGIELTDEERKEARDIALQKRDKREEFLASFKKVLEKARIKESKMDKNLSFEFGERVKRLKTELRLKVYGEQEDKINTFVSTVVGLFEFDLHSGIALAYEFTNEFVPNTLNDAEFTEAIKRLKEIGFIIKKWSIDPPIAEVALRVKTEGLDPI